MLDVCDPNDKWIPILLGPEFQSPGTRTTLDFLRARLRINPTRRVSNDFRGFLPARPVAERVKNALTPSRITLPDRITTTVSATLRVANAVKLGRRCGPTSCRIIGNTNP